MRWADSEACLGEARPWAEPAVRRHWHFNPSIGLRKFAVCVGALAMFISTLHLVGVFVVILWYTAPGVL